MDIETIIEVLESSLEKHGEKPLTNKWLLNILKLANDIEEKRELYNECYSSRDDNIWK